MLSEEELINKIAGKSITLTKSKLEEKKDINIVWDEIATECIRETREKTFNNEGWEDVDFADDYLYRMEFTKNGIRYYEGTEERYLDVPVGEESWNEPQWSREEIQMLIEGIVLLII